MKSFLSKKKFLFFITLTILIVSLSVLGFLSKYLGNLTNKIIEHGISNTWKQFLVIIPLYFVHYLIVVFYIYFQRLWLLELRKKIMSKKLKTNKSFEKAWNETNIYVNNYISPILQVSYILFGMISSLVVIITESYIMSIALFFIFIFSYFAPKIFSKKTKVVNKRMLEVNNEINEKISRFERNYLTISNTNEEMQKILYPISIKKVLLERKRRFYKGIRNWISSLIVSLVYITIIVTSAILIYFGKAKISIFIVATSAIGSYMHALPSLSDEIAEIKNNKWITKINDKPDAEYIKHSISKTNIKKIKVQNIKKKEIFSKQNFEIKKDQNILIMGKNGSGKSTIAKIIVGLEKHYSGKVIVNNKQETNYDSLPFIYQTSKASLIPGSVLENIINFKENYDKNKLYNVVNKLNIQKLINKKIKMLSSGEIALIKIAHILYNDYNVKIYDEVFMNIDKNNRKKILNIVLNEKAINIIISHSIQSRDLNKFDKIIKLS